MGYRIRKWSFRYFLNDPVNLVATDNIVVRTGANCFRLTLFYASINEAITVAYANVNAVKLNLSAFHLSTGPEVFVNAYGIPGALSEFSLSVRTRRHGRALCAAINHNMRSTKYGKPLLANFSRGRFEHMRLIVEQAQASCRIGLARAYWFQSDEDVYLDHPYLAFMPVGRFAIGNFLASLSWPTFKPASKFEPRPVPATADYEPSR